VCGRDDVARRAATIPQTANFCKHLSMVS
jgi:hypothetical protein